MHTRPVTRFQGFKGVSESVSDQLKLSPRFVGYIERSAWKTHVLQVRIRPCSSKANSKSFSSASPRKVVEAQKPFAVRLAAGRVNLPCAVRIDKDRFKAASSGPTSVCLPSADFRKEGKLYTRCRSSAQQTRCLLPTVGRAKRMSGPTFARVARGRG